MCKTNTQNVGSDNTCCVNVREYPHSASAGLSESGAHSSTIPSASYEIATETFQACLEMRRRRGELSTPPLDSQNRRLYSLPSVVVQREAFIANRESVPDSFQGERPWPRERDIPIRDRHVRRG